MTLTINEKIFNHISRNSEIQKHLIFKSIKIKLKKIQWMIKNHFLNLHMTLEM